MSSCVSLIGFTTVIRIWACPDGGVVRGAVTDCMLSLTTAWFQIPSWACEKVASDLGLGCVFRRVLRFSLLLTTR